MKKYYKKAVKKSMLIKKAKIPRTPKIDNVITKDFKFIGYTELTPTVSQGCMIGNSKNALTTNNIAFRPSMIPGTQRFNEIYSHFRFDKVTVRFIPSTVTAQVDDTDTGTATSNTSRVTPRFYCARVYGNENTADFTYESENSALIDGAKSCQMTKGLTMKFVPNTCYLTQTNRSIGGLPPSKVGWTVTKKQWHACYDSSTIFYGLKYLINDTFSDNNEFLYKVLVTARISFKGRNDANVQSDFGATSTLLSPFTAAT